MRSSYHRGASLVKGAKGIYRYCFWSDMRIGRSRRRSDIFVRIGRFATRGTNRPFSCLVRTADTADRMGFCGRNHLYLRFIGLYALCPVCPHIGASSGCVRFVCGYTKPSRSGTNFRTVQFRCRCPVPVNTGKCSPHELLGSIILFGGITRR